MIARRIRSTMLTLWPGILMIACVDPTAAADRLTTEHVARFRSVTSAVIAPDGSKVAYVLSIPRKPMTRRAGFRVANVMRSLLCGL